jgi:tetratricopeptide (TPR) repeat protein
MSVKEIFDLIKKKDFDRARSLIKKLSDEEYLEGTLLEGKILLFEKRYNDLLTLSKKSLEKSQELSNKLVELGSLVLESLALYYLDRKSNLSVIIDAADKVIDQIEPEKIEDVKEWIANLWNIKGSLLYHKKSYDKAIDSFHKNYKLHKELQNKKEMYFALDNICLINYDKGDYQSALKCQLKILPIIKEIDTKKNIAIFINDIGSTYMELGEFNTAQKYYQESLELFEEIGDDKSILLALDKLVKFNQKRGDKSQAATYKERFVKLKSRLRQ